MSTFTVTYDKRVIENKGYSKIILKTCTETYKSFQDAFKRAKIIRASGISANMPLIEEKK